VLDGSKIVNVITKIDLIDYVSKIGR